MTDRPETLRIKGGKFCRRDAFVDEMCEENPEWGREAVEKNLDELVEDSVMETLTLDDGTEYIAGSSRATLVNTYLKGKASLTANKVKNELFISSLDGGNQE